MDRSVFRFTGALLLALFIGTPLPAATADARCRLCLVGPDNMAFDAAGDLYLVDTDHQQRSRVLKISPSGTVLGQWHIFARRANVRNGPEGIAVTRAGVVLVTDAGANRVLEVSPEGKVRGAFGGASTTFANHNLGHLAIDRSGTVYVAQDKPNLIQRFSRDGRRLAAWHRDTGPAPDQWGPGGPETIATLSNGNLVVQDWSNARIVVLSPQGRTLSTFGKRGSGPGEFRVQSGIAIDERDRIFVSELVPARVQVFDAHGRLLTTVANRAKKALFRVAPFAIAVDKDGNIYSPDGLSLVKYNLHGDVLARWF